MNKKTKRGIILTSLASIAFAGSLLAGSTYALFTSESTTNIAVSSGTVDVSATISGLETFSGEANSLTGDPTVDAEHIKSYKDLEINNGKFLNGGTAEINADGDLELENVTPGDKVTFNITIKNNSTVAVKYHTIIKEEKVDEGGLFKGLKFKIGNSSNTEITDWDNLAAKSDDIVLPCEVSLPTDAGDEYQGKNAKISFTVEAVQGNAMVDKYCDTLEEAFNLKEGTFAADTTRTEALVIDGASEELKNKGIKGVYINKWVDGYANFDLTIRNVTFLNGLNLTSQKNEMNIILENCTVYACDQSKITATHKVNSGAGMCLNLEKKSARNVNYNITNCKFIGENDDSLPVYGNKYKNNGEVEDAYKKRGYGIAFDAIAGGDGDGGSIDTATINGCEISGVRGNAIQLHGNTGAITIKETNIKSWGINSGNYYKPNGNGGMDLKDGNSTAIRGDYYKDGSKRVNLENVNFGLAEGTHGASGKEVKLTHVYLGTSMDAYGGNTSADDSGNRVAGKYSYSDNRQ